MSAKTEFNLNGLELRKTDGGWQYLSEGTHSDPDVWVYASSSLTPFSGSGVDALLDEVKRLQGEYDKQAQEIERLRSIISDCAKSCGAAVSVECSLDFMAHLPVEIAAVISSLREDRDSQQRVCITAMAELAQLKSRQSGVVLPERDALRDIVAQAIGWDAYDCTRVWSAWGVGTMSEDDFVPVVEQEDRLYEITDACLDEVARLNSSAGRAGEAVATVSVWHVDQWYARDPSQSGRNIGIKFLGDRDKTLVDGTLLYTAPPAIPATQVLVERELLALCYSAVHALCGMKIDGYTESKCKKLRAILSSKGDV
ncbi:hypothetical protein [Pseudomonas segetis]|uniref:Uncharacterized protein n=1 Tax=Pseudomonas segetis TaxID=298908 RepID=A0A239CA05_9PSED|nr:hypothetical protein [Pseudomonas segetis]SNS16789.1 hypothetical protein SAMN05216255_1581 [Pseudomonas segetis]